METVRFNRMDRRMTGLFKSSRFKRSKRLTWYAADFALSGFAAVPACYVFIVDGRAVYIGSTSNLSTRMRAHRNSDLRWPFADIIVKYRPSKKYGDWAMLELRLLRRLRPVGNIKGVRRDA